MKMRRMFAALLVAALLLSVLPAQVLRVSAAEEEPGGLFLDKTATLTADGTYTINLEAYATGTPVVSSVKEGIPLDIVLVIDQSGSMQTQDYLESMKEAVRNFVNSVAENGKSFNVNHRVAITTFSNNEDGSQSGTVKDSDFTYVGQKDPSWANTGMFKNNGTYVNYGTAVYEQIMEDDDSFSTGEYYYVEIEDDEGNKEWVQIRYNSGWFYYAKSGNSSTVSIGRTSVLFDNYTVYKKTDCNYNLTDEDYAAAWMDVRGNDGDSNGINDTISNAINSFAANGSTYPSAGLIMAKNALDNLPETTDEQRNQLVVVFTDGQPGFSSDTFETDEANATLAASAAIKEAGAEVYTIGLYSSASEDTEKFMNYLSSNYGAVYNMDGEGAKIVYSPVATGAATAPTSSGTNPTDYYVLVDGAYHQVYTTRTSGSWGTRYYTWFYYDENNSQKTIQAASSSTTYSGSETLYLKTVEKLSEKYYHTTADMTKLNEIFQTITVDSTTTDTTIALGADAILKDVLATGFALTEHTVITVQTQAGSYSGSLGAFELTEDKISWGTVETVATLNYAQGKTATQNGYTITVTDSTVSAHGSSIDVTGFNYHEKYICDGHNGYRLLVSITGIEADASLATGTEVYTNHGSSGVYEPADSDVDNDGIKGEAQGSFENPTTYFNYVSYVMDYAKPMTPSTSGANLSEVISADKDGYHYFNPAVTGITDQYGKVSVANNAFTYEPITMNWNGYDSFFLFGKTDNATIKDADANASGNVWSKVTVIPANNVYYEDTFVTSESAGTVGIDFNGTWEQVSAGMNDSSTGGVHGWEDSLADDKGHSDGTAAVGGNGATATFTFTGTGVDIYSRTNMDTGLIMASLYAGNAAAGTPLRTLVIDNFAKSGDYYMIPTLSIHQLMLRDASNVPVKDADGNYVYTAMTYGTYTVKLTVVSVTNDADRDGDNETRSTYYLDGIRVYNPVAVDSTVKDAYGNDELNATFAEVRDILLAAGNFTEDGEGPVFIDQIVNKDENGNVTGDTAPTTTTEIGVYEAIGPENEVYLSADQMIVFAPIAGAKYYVGLKSPTGEPVTVYLSGDPMQELTITHEADLYYEVTPSENGFITIMNDSENLLAITKIKVTRPDAVMMKAMFRSASREEVLSAADDAYAVANEPETPDVEIENPEVEEPTPDPSEQIRELIKRLFENLWDWFH